MIISTPHITRKSLREQNLKRGTSFTIWNNIALIYFTNVEDRFCVIDVEDIPKVKDYNFQLDKTFGYAVTTKHRRIARISELVTGHKWMDHKDRDKLNNTKLNLRQCSLTESGCNRRKTKSETSSKYKGVHFDKDKNKWRAEIRYNNERIYLGRYDVEEDAAKQYDKWAKQYHGEFAVLNFN